MCEMIKKTNKTNKYTSYQWQSIVAKKTNAL